MSTGTHLTYPHANGFHDGRLVLSRYRTGAGATAIVVREGTGEHLVAEVAPRRDGQVRPVYPDVARHTGRVAWIWDDALYVADEPGCAERVFTPDTLGLVTRGPGLALQDLTSISADGAHVLLMVEHGDQRTCLRFDLATGTTTELFTKPWFANHPHHSPFDESWVAFAHEGPATATPDRVWAWHDGQTRQILDQHEISDLPGQFVAVGHERWLHHDLGAAVIAYGESKAGPRGLYLVYPDRPPRLVARGERHWHCDVSRDGRWAVVDTTGPADRPGRGWQDAGDVSDVLLIAVATGEQVRLARTRAASHPFHPHPVFTPEGDAVLFNHLDADGTISVSRSPVP
ncbi:oligogalacturonate lyase family protein [Nonomuraea sp. NPDC005983]|uniref:oligogalacturonate lyase family protein n=1 Tax=Nonomuraea sp. NPDC005983 TaxID=3155595 RepID=UPI0033ABCFB8